MLQNDIQEVPLHEELWWTDILPRGPVQIDLQNLKTSRESLVSRAILLVGLAMFTVNDGEFNLFGSIDSLIVVTSTTTLQSRSSFMPNEFKIMELQHNTIIEIPGFVLALHLLIN